MEERDGSPVGFQHDRVIQMMNGKTKHLFEKKKTETSVIFTKDLFEKFIVNEKKDETKLWDDRMR